MESEPLEAKLEGISEIKSFYSTSGVSLDREVNLFLKTRENEIWQIACTFNYDRGFILILTRIE